MHFICSALFIQKNRIQTPSPMYLLWRGINFMLSAVPCKQPGDRSHYHLMCLRDFHFCLLLKFVIESFSEMIKCSLFRWGAVVVLSLHEL